MSLDTAIDHLLLAKRISFDAAGTKKVSYFDDNPVEAQKVFAYLNGGPRPTGVASEMGLGLLDLEDVRRGAAPPPPPPPLPGATPIYLADFETGDFSQVISQQEKTSDRIALVTAGALQGAYSALIKNGPGDAGVAGSSTALRTELAFAFFANKLGGSPEGKDSWVTWDQKLDADFQIASWCVLTQFHGGFGSPVFAIEADPPAPNGVLYAVIRGGDVNANYRSIPIATPVPRGTLMRFKVHHHWSTEPSGRVRVWLNGVLVADSVGPNLYRGYETEVHHKAGIYRSAAGVTTDSQLLLDDVRWYDEDPG